MSAAAAAVNLNVTKTFLGNVLSTLFIKGKTVFSNGPRSLFRNSHDCTILDR